MIRVGSAHPRNLEGYAMFVGNFNKFFTLMLSCFD